MVEHQPSKLIMRVRFPLPAPEVMFIPSSDGIGFTEEYRSGCNELHSKCSCPQGHVGSNPTSSAISRDVAQFGSALGSGLRGRGFESHHLDH